MKSKFYYSLIFFALAILFSQCSDDFTPKPKGYFRIDLPKKTYQQYSSAVCPFTFEYPFYAKLETDSLFFNRKVENPCWFNLILPELGGEIHISYKEIGEKYTLPKLIEDAYKLSFKHTIKAEFIDESVIRNKNNVSGILYEIGGNAASNIQFYLTDSTSHFLRGSLYFQAIPNADSLAPVVQFVKEDIIHMISTFEWSTI